ncbi:hypothetical protein [Allokutzneria sp. NRRL B-24872]|uniref:hypothetical protein n=1 Tax=Allokutzneria sp. NRRL B-24872 TaxID=1137961 RepID=UPI000A39BB46|nr:hypothetical protein [Allokutzneria sp. NRRL B-24872]
MDILKFGTGNLTTAVADAGRGRFRWTRRAGRLRSTPLALAPLGVLAAAEGASTGAVRFTVPSRVGDALVYDLPAPISIGWLTADPNADLAVHSGLIRDTGAAVRALHETPVPTGFSAPSPRLTELRDWLTTGAGSNDSAFLHAVAADRFGPRRWRAAEQWCADLLHPGENAVLCHGSLGLGMLVADPGSGAASLMTGTQLCVAPAAYDLGWFLGALHLLRATTSARFEVSSARLDHGSLALSFMDGYGEFDRTAVGRAAVLCCLNHIRCLASYVGWQDDVLRAVDVVAELADTEGHAALNW